MPANNIETLVDQAHQIFNQTSIHEVIDMTRGAATATLLEFYEDAGEKDIKRYLDVVELLRIEAGT